MSAEHGPSDAVVATMPLVLTDFCEIVWDFEKIQGSDEVQTHTHMNARVKGMNIFIF